jgi:hypothetical protein
VSGNKSTRLILAIVEIFAVFGLAYLSAQFLNSLPAVTNALAPYGNSTKALVIGWLPLVIYAFVAERLLRRRGLSAWGLKPVEGSWRETIRITVYLLVLGGFVPLVIAGVDGEAEALRSTVTGQVSAVLGPVLAQEVFLLGYAQGRLRDEMPGLLTVFPISIAFLVAHLAHLDGSITGVLFFIAIAWQALVWACARAALDSVVPQIIAHAILLVLFLLPLPGAVAVGIAGLIVMTTMAHWARRKLKELRRALRTVEPAKS